MLPPQLRCGGTPADSVPSVAAEQGRPERVQVTSPRTVARRPRPTEVGRQIDDQTGLGEVYMRSLVRTQLRLAAGVLGLVVGPLAALPLVFVAAPSVRETTTLGLPLPWLVLAVLRLGSAQAWHVRST